MAPAFAILASNDAAAKVASKNSSAAGVQLFQSLGASNDPLDRVSRRCHDVAICCHIVLAL